MNVGMTTATATNQGLTAGRLTATGESATVLMRQLLCQAARGNSSFTSLPRQ